MLSMRKFTLSAVLFVLVLLSTQAYASPFVVSVSAQSNIFGAGRDCVPYVSASQPGDPGGLASGAGIMPTTVYLAPSPNLYLYFPSVTGTIYFNADPKTGHGADGIKWEDLSTNIDSIGGVSGISRKNSVLFMVGVFLGPNGQPLTAPVRQNASNADAITDFHPLLGQTFFIGNGLTSNGTTQKFYVPEGATRLYFGFADGWDFTGSARWFADNSGSLTVAYNFGTGPSPSGAPEPATFALLGGGLLLVGLRSRLRLKKR